LPFIIAAVAVGAFPLVALVVGLIQTFVENPEQGLLWTACLVIYITCLCGSQWSCGGPGPELATDPSNSVSGTSLWLCSWIATALAGAMVFASGIAWMQVWGLGVLTASFYGTLNDLRACWMCVEYFSNGHTGFHVRLIATNNWVCNALVWGPYATWMIGFWFGLVLSFLSRTPMLSHPVSVEVIAGGCAVAIILGLLLSGTSSNRTHMSI